MQERRGGIVKLGTLLLVCGCASLSPNPQTGPLPRCEMEDRGIDPDLGERIQVSRGTCLVAISESPGLCKSHDCERFGEDESCLLLKEGSEAQFQPFDGAIIGMKVEPGHRYLVEARKTLSEKTTHWEDDCSGETTVFEVTKVISDNPLSGAGAKSSSTQPVKPAPR